MYRTDSVGGTVIGIYSISLSEGIFLEINIFFKNFVYLFGRIAENKRDRSLICGSLPQCEDSLGWTSPKPRASSALVKWVARAQRSETALAAFPRPGSRELKQE